MLGITALAIFFIVAGLLRADLVAILVLATLPLTGLVTYEESLSGFSRRWLLQIFADEVGSFKTFQNPRSQSHE